MQYVIINEEYGYRIWMSKVTPEKTKELLAWWKSLETVTGMFYDPSSKFPVPLTELTENNRDDYPDLIKENVAIYVELHEDHDSRFKVMGDQVYYHRGYFNINSLQK
jgi:hypothetical protein